MSELDSADIEATQAQRTFRSHANYLRAFSLVIRGDLFVSAEDAMARVARDVSAFPDAGGHGPHDDGVLTGCLTRAWGTELLLATGRRIADDDELLRLTNSWGVVQAYYVAYSATQALIVAEGKARPTAHPPTQRQAVDLWVTRGGSVAPWSLAVAAHSHRLAADDGTINGPGRPIDEQMHPWSACDPHSCWDIAAAALRSTRGQAIYETLTQARRRKLTDRKRAWRHDEAARLADGRPPRREPTWPVTAKLTHDEMTTHTSRVRPYTMLDYLYRLRVKANYEDATVFTEGPEDRAATQRVAVDLELVASATLLAHELRVGRLIGRDTLLAKVDTWLREHRPPGPSLALAARRDLLADSL